MNNWKNLLNPDLSRFKTLWGLWWGMVWRIYAFVLVLYILMAFIGFLGIGYNAL